MTYKEIQDAVILDRFSETQRDAIKFSINSRYGRVWALEPWTFKREQILYNLPNASVSVLLSDLGLTKVEAVDFYPSGSANSRPMNAARPEDWSDIYNTALRSNPSDWTVFGGRLHINGAGSGILPLLVLGQITWQPLVGDNDVPLLPPEYHFMLVQGAAADMLLREADPTWQGEEKSFNDQVGEMRYSYMSVQPMARTAYPAWP